MEHVKQELKLRLEPAAGEGGAACKKAVLFLLRKYIEGCEENEGICIYESINGGAGRKGLFDAGSKE